MTPSVDLPSLLTRKQRAAVRLAAQGGRYQLLLGAGSSLDSVNSSGHKLPGGRELIDLLRARFDVLVEEGDALWRVYDRALVKENETSVYFWLREHLSNVTHPGWMEFVARFPWQRVWTLNVDDTFESAYAKVASPSSRNLISVNWNDAFSSSNNLEVVHLHGMVSRPDPQKLVFSLSEYYSSTQSRAPWPAMFRDEYGVNPFVIIGARVRDEPDLEAVVRNRVLKHNAPSFYVATEISRGTEEDLVNWGLIPVRMSAEEFILSWYELIGLDLDLDAEDTTATALRVGRQFNEVTRRSLTVTEEKHDFLGGDEPNWADAGRGLIAELGFANEMKLDCSRLGLSEHTATIVAYTGRPLSGRSAALRLVGTGLLEAGYRTFLFQGQGRLDTPALIRLGASMRQIALLFDGFVDVADDLDQLVTEARRANINLCVLCVDDSRNDEAILGRISPANLTLQRLGRIPTRLKRGDSGILVNKLASHGRLGIIEYEDDRARVSHFTDSNIFDAMAALEEAPGFGLRVKLLVDRIGTSKTPSLIHNAVLITAFAAYVGRPVPLADLARMIGIDSDLLLDALDGPNQNPELSDLLSTDGVWVRTRQRHLALTHVVTAMSPAAAANALSDAIRRVSDRLTFESWRDRTALSRLVGAFMQAKNLKEVFPSVDHEQWYEGLRDVFGEWSARYWEQRAILGRLRGDSDMEALSRAESFASRAVTLWKDTYSLTTLGTVLMQKAAIGNVNVETYYRRAEAAFAAAIDFDPANSIIASGAYLKFTLQVLNRIQRPEYAQVTSSASRALLEEVVHDWTAYYARRSAAGLSSEGVQDQQEKLLHEYRSIVQD